MIKAKVRLYRVKMYLLFGAIGILLIANLFLSVALFTRDSMTILVPTITSKMSVGTGFVGREYLKARADQIMNLLFGMRLETAQSLKTQLLRQFDSSSKGHMKRQIDSFIEDISKRGYYYVFNVLSREIDEGGLSVLVTGDLEVYLADAKLKVTRKTYKLSFVNRGGIVNLKSFEGMGDEEIK